jgi:hypothetical protein
VEQMHAWLVRRRRIGRSGVGVGWAHDGRTEPDRRRESSHGITT